MKLNKIDTSYLVQVNKMFRWHRENEKFLKILMRTFLEKFIQSFNTSHKMFTLFHCLIVSR